MINDYRLSGYSLLKVLQKGSCGEVELALHKELGCRRIIKTIYRTHPQYDTLTKEARTLQKIRNEAIPIVYDVIENACGMSFIEEAIDGETLTKHLKRKMHLTGSEILDYSVKLTEILIYLHNPARGILHLDLKPDNIIVSDKKMKLIDFGSAICYVEETDTVDMFGSKGYSAPEQSGDGEICEATDIYALGKIFEYMLMYAPIVPKGYEAIVKNCIRIGEELYTSAEEVKADLLGVGGKIGKYKEETWLAVVGVPSDFHGSFFAFELAKQLRSKSGKKVLLLDCNSAGNLEALEKNNNKSDSLEFVFRTDSVTIAKGVLPQEAKNWRGLGGDVIICDFGNTNPKEAGIPFEAVLCVGSMRPWTEKFWTEALSNMVCGRKTYAFVTDGYIIRKTTLINEVFDCRTEKGLKNATRCISQLITRRNRKD
ncbi:MAG: protein kinase [Lachnospiraceae bacterium]|nr:protein kinase [Lachnospiraceae bacterium]